MLRSGIHSASAMATMVLAMVPGTSAQRLLEKDGIELRGTARVVTYAAAKCNVLEANHTEAEYERIKANHGQPLDVWQLEFSVHNGSGKWLDHLIARYGIESKWPDCTNWSGPSGTYPEPVEWSSTLGHIQKSGRNVVAPGTTLTDTTFILAFHEDQPRFERWSVDFTFGESSSVSDAAGTGTPPGSPPRPLAGDQPVAGTGDRHQPSGINGEQTCAGLAEGAACWKILASHPGCHVWDDRYYPGQTVTWTGGCSGGQASGTGTLQWIWGSEVNEASGLLRNGKRDGYWVLRFASGTVEDGPFEHGDFFGSLERLTSGRVEEGRYLSSKRNGHWIVRYANGDVREGPYVDGKMHGRWIARNANGTTQEGPYANGQANGHWVLRDPDGDVEEGSYLDGKRNGHWVERTTTGYVEQGPYKNDKKHGRWVQRWADGTVGEGSYVDGEQTGRWVVRYPDGRPPWIREL